MKLIVTQTKQIERQRETLKEKKKPSSNKDKRINFTHESTDATNLKGRKGV